MASPQEAPATPNEDLQLAIQRFNALPRESNKNNWIILVCQVGSKHDLIFVVNTHIRRSYNIRPRPGMTLRGKTGEELATLAVPLLIGLFIREMEKGAEPFAPWAWSTYDSDLSKSLPAQLKASGIRDELCIVGIASYEERIISDSLWAEWQMAHVVVPRCKSCKRSEEDYSSSGFEPVEALFLCGRCMGERYCGKECQEEDWKNHQRMCDGIIAGRKAKGKEGVCGEAESQVEKSCAMNTEVSMNFNSKEDG